MIATTILVTGMLTVAFLYNRKSKVLVKARTATFLPEWRKILVTKVNFYVNLNEEEKRIFEAKLETFLAHCEVTGIDTKIDDTDRLLVASSAVIPIFAFNGWMYRNISEVLVYPNSFNEKFETSGTGRTILGMVGTGYMNGKMILSKEALHHGFSNESDKKNTAIHEFIHLIDKEDGAVDGLPEILLERPYSLPWLKLIRQKIAEINQGSSDINPYGATNEAEFFAVAGEYFFERPQLLASKHPELYRLLEKIFKQKMRDRIGKVNKKKNDRNDLCNCGSTKKFKKCCGSLAK